LSPIQNFLNLSMQIIRTTKKTPAYKISAFHVFLSVDFFKENSKFKISGHQVGSKVSGSQNLRSLALMVGAVGAAKLFSTAEVTARDSTKFEYLQ